MSASNQTKERKPRRTCTKKIPVENSSQGFSLDRLAPLSASQSAISLLSIPACALTLCILITLLESLAALKILAIMSLAECCWLMNESVSILKRCRRSKPTKESVKICMSTVLPLEFSGGMFSMLSRMAVNSAIKTSFMLAVSDRNFAFPDREPQWYTP